MKVHKYAFRTDRGFRVHSADMKVLLGLSSKAKLPAEGMPARIISGVKVWVVPAVPVYDARTSRRVKSSLHRVRAECPDCRREMSAGRLFQHVC